MTLLNFIHKTRNIDRTEQEHKLNQRLRKQEDSATQKSITQLSSLNNWFGNGIDEISFYFNFSPLLLLHFSNSIYFQNLETIPVHCAESWRFTILEAYKDIDPISTVNNKNTLAQL